MTEVAIAVLSVGGALVMALGGLGLIRFPDVFTRMHASAKAAVVGVIAITSAAALATGTAAGALVLGLVVALLFLSGPLGMSLLARAAYHDPETPRLSRTRELTSGRPATRSAGARVVAGASPALALWLFGVWVALFGSFRSDVVIGGVLVAAAVAFVLRALAPRWPEALLHPVAALRFVGRFIVDVVAATWDVITTIFVPTGLLQPAIVEVPLRAQTRNEIALLMNAVSFTPGTVALELHDRMLSVHVLNADDPQEVVEGIEAMETRIIQAFGGSTDRTKEDEIKIT